MLTLPQCLEERPAQRATKDCCALGDVADHSIRTFGPRAPQQRLLEARQNATEVERTIERCPGFAGCLADGTKSGV